LTLALLNLLVILKFAGSIEIFKKFLETIAVDQSEYQAKPTVMTLHYFIKKTPLTSRAELNRIIAEQPVIPTRQEITILLQI
jgi:hypothetical protein